MKYLIGILLGSGIIGCGSRDNSPTSSVTVEQPGHMPLETNESTRDQNTEGQTLLYPLSSGFD